MILNYDLVAFVGALTEHYGASDVPAMRTDKYRVFRNPWSCSGSGGYIFIYGGSRRPPVYYGQSRTRASPMSAAMVERIATRVMHPPKALEM